MINWIKSYFKNRKRELPLIHFHTFETGEKIYTYRQSDWGRLSSRYYRAINEASNNLKNFAAKPEEWKAFISGGKALALAGMNCESVKDMREKHAEMYNAFSWWESRSAVKNPMETFLEMQYCLFFCLEDEKETGYSEIYNAKKIELLNNAPPETRDFFLQTVKEILKDFLPTLEEDTLSLILRMERIKGEAEAQKASWSTPVSGTN